MLPKGHQLYRLILETVLLCIVGLGMGLVINRHIVAQGFDGSLVEAIKQTLQNKITEKAQPAGAAAPTGNIIMMSVEQAKELCDSGRSLFIDARAPDAYEAGHISGAVNITEQTLEDHVFALMDKVRESRVIIYCSSAECPQSMELAELLIENDIKPVYVFSGGLDQWQKMGYPVVRGGGR